jgi:selenocysteine-specific elongation factor
MYVIATAGHVDHGKSTLVRLLTGMEPDRWAEERRRGMTIDLGFAWMTLPAGERLAFVDVPGHERFVTNMLAGVGPVPAVLFVVAADEGWMPQSAEHLAAIAALGVRHCLLVVTRADLTDPGPALSQARSRIAAAGVPVSGALAVSGRTGAGMDRLALALRRLTAGLPQPDVTAPVRLWVDRVFTIRGSGTVATGTLPAGTVSRGDELMLVPGSQRIRVRALESLKERGESAAAVARVAVNIRGADRHEMKRGMALVTPGRWIMTGLIDVVLRSGPGDQPVGLPPEMTLHIGSAKTTVRTRMLGAEPAGAPGQAVARLALSQPLPLHVGDKALLRDGNQRHGRQHGIIGVTVLDVVPPPLRRRGAAARRGRSLGALAGPPDGRFHLGQHGLLRRDRLIAMGCMPPSAPVVGGWLADPGHWSVLGQRLRAMVDEYASRHPLQPGMPAEAARQRLGLPDHQLLEALARPPLRLAGGRVFTGQSAPQLPERTAAAVELLRRELQAGPFRAPDAERLTRLGLGARELAAAVRAGQLLSVAAGVVLLPGADAEAADVLAGLPQPFTASEARQALDTTRRVAIPLLEYLDRKGFTERVGDTHRRCRAGGSATLAPRNPVPRPPAPGPPAPRRPE